MKIPNADHAVVDIAKLRDYCLSEDHLRGRHKSRVFAAALGLAADQAQELHAALLRAAQEEDAALSEKDEYGQRYIVDFTMNGPAGKAAVRSAWIIRLGEDFPRLTSCYVI